MRAGTLSPSAPAAAPAGVVAGFASRSVHLVARDLIGATLLCDGVGGTIVEVESYERDDPACHAFVGRTERNAVLFGPPGHAYVYLSYGIHSLLNLVCEPEGSAAAVLIRALEPIHGLEAMRARRGLERREQLCSGPGKLAQALGVGLDRNGARFGAAGLELVLDGPGRPSPEVVTAPRIGIARATERPWRFCAAGSRFVSRPWPRPGNGRGAQSLTGR